MNTCKTCGEPITWLLCGGRWMPRDGDKPHECKIAEKEIKPCKCSSCGVDGAWTRLDGKLVFVTAYPRFEWPWTKHHCEAPRPCSVCGRTVKWVINDKNYSGRRPFNEDGTKHICGTPPPKAEPRHPIGVDDREPQIAY